LFFNGFIRLSIKKVRLHFIYYLPRSYNSIRVVLYITRELLGLVAIYKAAFKILYSKENLPRL
ncbi:hypothetical protein BKA59DRAFT_404662, partial [Fusarium tricinctum]